ncbi:MAG: hypothetical protein U0R50_17360 [Gaiellales bacterium]
MRVVTKLAKLEFTVGTIRRDGDELVIDSHPDQAMKAQARVGVDDFAALFRASLNRAVLGYLFALPWRLLRRHRAQRMSLANGPRPRRREPGGIHQGGEQQ